MVRILLAALLAAIMFCGVLMLTLTRQVNGWDVILPLSEVGVGDIVFAAVLGSGLFVGLMLCERPSKPGA